MKQKLLCIALLCLATSAALQAQVVEGKLTDELNQPLEFVNVVLLSPADSSFVQGSVSMMDGSFKIAGIADQAYILRASSVGYQTLYQNCRCGSIGTLSLSSDAVMLNEAVVTARRPTYQLKGSSLVANIQNTLLSTVGTGNDVLKRIPGVQGDDGTFTVFGKGTPLIYINGRQVRDASELDRLNSQDILSVELITNPGPEYDATVKSVLRIRTVKPTGEGFGASTRAYIQQGYHTRHLEMLDVNYRRGGFELNATGQYDLWKQHQDQRDKHHVVTPDTEWRQDADMTMNTTSGNFYARLGLSYALNEKHSFGASYETYGSPNQESRIVSDYYVTADGIFHDQLHYDALWKEDKMTHQVNAYYVGSVGKWGVDFNADLLTGDGTNDQLTQEESQEQDSRLVTSLSTTKNKLYAAKLVFSRPLGGAGELRLGGEYSYVNRLNRYDNPQNLLPSTDSEIEEQKLAAFAGYAVQWGKLQAEAGLRFEHIFSDYYDKEVYMPGQSRDYDNLFPNLSLALPLGQVQTSMSYTVKTRRPSFYELRSNMQYNDRFTYEGGNPLLQPETNHDITLMASYKWVQLSLNYQYRKDAMEWMAEPYADDPAITVMTTQNYDQAQAINASLSLSPKWGFWEPVFSTFLKKPFFESFSMGEKRAFNSPYAYFSFTNAFRLGEGFYLNIDGNFRTRGNDGAVMMKPSGSVNASLFKSFFKERLSLNLQGFDLFATQRNSMFLYGTSMTFDKWNYSDFRQVRFTVRYKFNATRSKYKGTGAAQEEIQRL